MATAYIVDAVRTAGGRRGGRLAGVHPVDPRRSQPRCDRRAHRHRPDRGRRRHHGLRHPGRSAGNAGGPATRCSPSKLLPQSTPAVTIDRQCGSSQQAIPVRGAGCHVWRAGYGHRGGRREHEPRADGLQRHVPHEGGARSLQVAGGWKKSIPGSCSPQFMGAEMIVKKHGFTKDDLDRFSLDSHRKAIAATNAQAFANEIVPVEIETPEGPAMHTVDEGIPLRRYARGHRRRQAAQPRRLAHRCQLQPDLRWFECRAGRVGSCAQGRMDLPRWRASTI